MQQQQQPQATAIADVPQRVQQPDECSVCLSVYDEVDRRPRNLPCGHTYCSLCVSVLLKDGHLTCPNCRTDHHTPDVDHFPISYALEAMTKVMRTLQVEAVSQASGKTVQATEAETKERAAAGLSRNLQSVVQDQKVSLESLETTLQKEMEQLNQYRAKLAVSRTKHAHMLKELDKVVQRHQASMDQLQEEDVKVEGLVAEGQEAQRELRAAQGQLDQVNTAEEAFTTIDDIDRTIVQAENWLQHSKEEIPNGTCLRTSIRVLEATEPGLKVIAKYTKTTPTQATSGHTNSTIMEAVENVEGQVELEALHTEFLRKKVAADQVFATQKYAGDVCYSSKVTFEENKVYLHNLKNESPPQWAFTLQVSKTLENLAYPDISVFLDLIWPGTSSQRVHINLVADTPLTRQFVTLCMGHTGLTYWNTDLLNTENYNHMKITWGGDTSGQKAAADQVLPPIQANECGGPVVIKPGMVVATTDLSNAVQRTQFGIVFYDDSIGHEHNPSFYHLGSVDADGLRVVETAADMTRRGTKVRVLDCGIVY